MLVSYDFDASVVNEPLFDCRVTRRLVSYDLAVINLDLVYVIAGSPECW